MTHHKNDLNSLLNWNPFRSHRDEQTYKKIHRHLTDINDTISEDDIRNIKIIAFTGTLSETHISKKQEHKLAV